MNQPESDKSSKKGLAQVVLSLFNRNNQKKNIQ